MPTEWDYETTITEEELVRGTGKRKVSQLVIQHTPERTYQVLLKVAGDRTWMALVTRRARHHPRQFMSLPKLLQHLVRRFPYLEKVTVEELNPAVITINMADVRDGAWR